MSSQQALTLRHKLYGRMGILHARHRIPFVHSLMHGTTVKEWFHRRGMERAVGLSCATMLVCGMGFVFVASIVRVTTVEGITRFACVVVTILIGLFV